MLISDTNLSNIGFIQHERYVTWGVNDQWELLQGCTNTNIVTLTKFVIK